MKFLRIDLLAHGWHVMRATKLLWYLTVVFLISIPASAESRLSPALIQSPSQTADEDGITALMRAARDGEKNALKALLKESADINAADVYGWTALTYAARRGDAWMIAALINKGAELNLQSEEGWTPLMYAVSEGFADAVKLLLERGANASFATKSGLTPLGIAEQRAKLQHVGGGTVQDHNRAGTDEQPHDYAAVIELLKQVGAVSGHPGEQLQLSPPVDSRPVALNHPYPSYTEEARRRKINARIPMRVLVAEDGLVKKVRVLAGAPFGLTEQAVISAKKLTFKPATKSGKPVEFWVSLYMDFNVR